MSKMTMKIAMVLIILILLGVYVFNIFSVDTVEKDNYYDLEVMQEYTVSRDILANDEAAYLNDKEGIFKISQGETVYLLEADRNFAKVEYTAEDLNYEGFIDAWYLTEESSKIKDADYLGIVTDATSYYLPKSVALKEREEKINGLVRVVGEYEGCLLVLPADFDYNFNDYVWIDESTVESYNSLKINIGRISSNATIYNSEELEEQVSEEIKNELLTNLVKVEEIENSAEYYKVRTKNEATGIIKKTDFIAISLSNEIN